MTLVKTQIQKQTLECIKLENLQQYAWLQEVIECLNDGILILNKQGKIIYINQCARRICRDLNQEIEISNSVPPSIWNVCKVLIENSSLFPDKTIGLADKIVIGNSDTFVVCVQWLNLSQFEYPCFLVTIKNQCHSLQTVAIAEAQIYGLTPSETKVWLLYRANYTYKQVAAELFITINTVKKHMKNIYAKRQAILATDDQ